MITHDLLHCDCVSPANRGEREVLTPSKGIFAAIFPLGKSALFRAGLGVVTEDKLASSGHLNINGRLQL